MMATSLVVEALETRDCPSLTPLDQLGLTPFDGLTGGLYPGGQNVAPAAFLAQGEATAATIQPLDANGNPDPVNGKIVLVVEGMSNTKRDADAWIASLAGNPNLNPHLVVIDAAQPGKDALAWATTTAPWTTLLSDLAAAGVTAKQVQAMWLGNADKDPSGDFLTAARTLQGHLETIAQRIPTFLPDVKLTYWSSVNHTFTSTPGTLQPEPFAYGGGFAQQFVEADAIQGKLVGTPQEFWGPYLWADPTNGTTTLDWTQADVISDGVHPSTAGTAEIARVLTHFFSTDPTAAPWFLRHTAAPSPAPQIVPARHGPTATATVTPTPTGGDSGAVAPHTTAGTTGATPPTVSTGGATSGSPASAAPLAPGLAHHRVDPDVGS
jgi:hypothetical protein